MWEFYRGAINIRRKLELPARCRRRGGTVAKSVTSEVTGDGESGWNEFCAPPSLGAIEVGAMLGSHRERNPSRSENWHRRTMRYTPALLRRHPLREFRGIPRLLVTGGGDRVRFAISGTNTPRRRLHNQPSWRIHRRHRRGAESFGGGEGAISSVSSTEATPSVRAAGGLSSI